jgi:transcription elongation GreA/GreB family factor
VTIPEELQNAMYSGDILESSEYSEILTRQNLLSSRLIQLNKRLNLCNFIDVTKISKTSVGIGSIVTLYSSKTDSVRILKIVPGEINDDIETNTSYEEVTLNSPIGQNAVLNKCINDDITVNTPNGMCSYTIISLNTIHDLKTKY